MTRSILIVNAVQVITSENNPYGIYNQVSGFPKVFDSGIDGNIEQNMKNAKAAYYAQLSANYSNANAARVMMTVTLEAVDGRQILRESIGVIPSSIVEPEEPEEPIEPEA